MKAIKVNADYESVLFKNKSLPVINEALEFLAFYLDPRPVLTKKIYSPEYLKHVESFTGNSASTVREGAGENWWGELMDLPRERKLNSKELSAGLNSDAYILNSLEDLPALGDTTYLAKNPFGMSGQNFTRVKAGDIQNLETMLKNGKVILEPLFERTHDFSYYIFPNGEKICYQNIVDERFQYRGTVFNDYTSPFVQNLSFYKEVSSEKWENFSIELEKVISFYKDAGAEGGFSVDSFIYQNGIEKDVRALSEVNYRRTMGRVAFELSLKFGGIRRWSALVLSKSTGESFESMKKKMSKIEWKENLSRGVILLSPGNVRYDMFFLSALNAHEGKVLLNELQELLPDSEFSIKL